MKLFWKKAKSVLKKISKRGALLNSREMRMGVALGVVVLVSMGLAITTFLHPNSKDEASGENQAPAQVFYHPFTGAVLEGAWQESVYVYGVMVENSYDAWPLSGVEDAFLVIEAPVEGSIPRFLALFTSDMEVEEIGPVRSARPYYVEWATAWGAIYHHVGGSPEALALIRELETKDVDEFYNGSTFWRGTKRFAPHNVYTSIKRLTAHADSKAYATQTEGFFTFESMDPGVDASSIKITWFDSASTYDVAWALEDGKYVRSQGTSVAKSADGDRYVFDNVIVMETDVRSVDAVDRKHLRTTGEGEALIFRNGNKTEITWKRESESSPLRFYDVWGNEVKLLPGKAWITVVEDLGKAQVSQ